MKKTCFVVALIMLFVSVFSTAAFAVDSETTKTDAFLMPLKPQRQ